MPMGVYLTKNTVEKIISQYEHEKNMSQIGRNFNLHKSTITKVLIRNNLHKRKKLGRTYQLNEHYFDNIDTEDKAYWLGFIAADGCIYKNNLSFCLSNKDIRHLEKFKDKIKATAPIKEYKSKNKCQFVLNSKHLVKSLMEHNILPRKSLIVTPSNLIPKLMEKHYWRGMIDGDGWISKSIRPTKVIWTIGLCSGSKIMIQAFEKYIKNNFETKANITKNKNIYQFSCGGTHLPKKIAKHFYFNSNEYLNRKMNKVIELMNYSHSVATKKIGEYQK